MSIALCAALVLFVLVTVMTPDASRMLGTYVASAAFPRGSAFNTTNPHKNGWCKDAVCHNSPVCTPCNKRYLFIIAPGRTGSTTLLSMFNKLPGVRLSGENYNELHVAHDLVQNVFGRENFEYDLILPEGSFRHNAIPTGALSCVTQHLVDTLNPPPMWLLQEAVSDKFIVEHESNMINGMKTIRLQDPFEGSKGFTPTEAVEFLNESFPCSRFIIGERSNHESHAKSTHALFNEASTPISFYINNAKKNQAYYQEMQNLFGPDKARTVDLDKWMHDVEILNDVVNWLGFTNCRFDQIIHENDHGYEPDSTHHIHLGDHCKAPLSL